MNTRSRNTAVPAVPAVQHGRPGNAKKIAAVAQLVERNLAKVEVESSRLFCRSRKKREGREAFPFFIFHSVPFCCRPPPSPLAGLRHPHWQASAIPIGRKNLSIPESRNTYLRTYLRTHPRLRGKARCQGECRGEKRGVKATPLVPIRKNQGSRGDKSHVVARFPDRKIGNKQGKFGGARDGT